MSNWRYFNGIVATFIFFAISIPVSARAGACAGFGVNLEGVSYYSAENPFIDIARTAMPWRRPWGSHLEEVPLDLDQFGHLRHLRQGAAQTILNDDNWGRQNQERRYLLTFEGKGEIALNLKGASRLLWRSLNRAEFTFKPGRLGLSVGYTDASDPIRDIRVIPIDQEKRLKKTPFRDDFISRWKDFHVLRYLNYQAINNSDVQEWSDRKMPNSFGAKGGVPLEDIIQLANETRTDPWLMVPHRASDEFVRKMAELVRDQLDPSLKIYLEYSNELWNSSFRQFHWLKEQAHAEGISRQAWQVKRSLQIYRIWDEVIGNRIRTNRVLATQFYNTWHTEQLIKHVEKGQFDILAVGYYLGGEWGRPPLASSTIKMTLDQLLENLILQSLPKIKKHLIVQKKLAEEKGLQLAAYEAGQHLVGSGHDPELGPWHNQNELTSLFIAANRDPRMGNIYHEMDRIWKQEGGGLLIWFAGTGRPGKWGSWGLLEFAGQPVSEAPKFQAAKSLLAKCHQTKHNEGHGLAH
jgi:hypothetical protein